MASDEEDKGRLVFENFCKAAEVYDASPFFPLCGLRLVDLVDIQSGDRVLDVACGTGAVLLPAAERIGPGGSVVGIDLTPPMVAVTKAKIAAANLHNAEVRAMDATMLDFRDASFDTVVCGFAIWFIPDMQGAFQEMWRVLKPGGKLAVSVWGPLSELAKKHREIFTAVGGSQADLNSHSVTTPEAVNEVLKTAGFQVEQVLSEDISVLYPDEEHWWAQRMANSQVSQQSLDADTLERFKHAAFTMVQDFKRADGVPETRNAVFAVARRP
jgi:ubiquinone/menaquinone biosynthesis C-methylase UbiE